MRRTIAVVALAVLMVTAGCQTIAPQADGEASPSQVSTTAGDTVRSPGSDPSMGANSTGNSPARTGEAVPATLGVYDRLYGQTIDSVVQLKVVHTNGRSSIGSGFVYDAKGRIVTNWHVVKRAATVMVRFRNGTWQTGTVIGSDVFTDLAVVDVDGLPAYVEPLPVAERNVQPGDPVVALGSPFGLEGTITHGLVSGINRSMPTRLGFTIPDTIQTDAPINPGNSGGPLLSLAGRVVGVNRATRGDNVGFAISADVVERVVPSLIETGTFQYPYLGVRTKTVTPIIADANDLERARGVIVTRHLPKSPSRGVLREAEQRYTQSGRVVPVDGDVIIRIESRPIQTKQALARYLLLHTRPGETVSLVVLRDGQRRQVTVELIQRPEYQSD